MTFFPFSTLFLNFVSISWIDMYVSLGGSHFQMNRQRVIWKPLGVIWRPPGGIWRPLGVIWRPPEVFWRPLGVICRTLGLIWRLAWVNWGILGVIRRLLGSSDNSEYYHSPLCVSEIVLFITINHSFLLISMIKDITMLTMLTMLTDLTTSWKKTLQTSQEDEYN